MFAPCIYNENICTYCGTVIKYETLGRNVMAEEVETSENLDDNSRAGG
jgi:hypothetical protein